MARIIDIHIEERLGDFEALGLKEDIEAVIKTWGYTYTIGVSPEVEDGEASENAKTEKE